MQQEFFGRGSSHNVSQTLSSLEAKRVLLVTGKASYSECGARERFEPLLAPYELRHFNEFAPNPKFEEALAGARLCQEFGADAIVAIGGGSAMDVAKCIAAFHSQPGQEKAIATGKQPLGKDVLPVVAVPTTAGTGSESTHFAVVYVDGDKYSLAAQEIMPSTAILDPVYTDRLPAYITACTGFDALCQAVESFWSVGATTESRDYAAQAIQLLLANLRQATNAPNTEVRDNMLCGANYAGKAINISKTTAPHALSYAITSMFGIPHGHAVAMTLGAFFPFHEPRANLELSGNLSLADYTEANQQLLNLLGVGSADDARRMWYQLMHDCSLDLHAGDYELANSPAVEPIVAKVNTQRLSNHPIILSSAQLAEIIRSIAAA